MLKVLYLPIGWQTGTIEAFQAVGCDVHVYDYYGAWEHTRSKSRIESDYIAKVREIQPQLVFMQLQLSDLISPQIIQESRKICPGVVIANWTGDIRGGVNSNFLTVGKVVDFPLISSTGQLDMYKGAGCSKVQYWQIGYDPKAHFPQHLTNFQYDVSFLANNYGNVFPDGTTRLAAANHLRGAFGARFGLFGNGYQPAAPQMDPSKATDIYNKSVCALSISNFNSISHYFSDRLLHCLASGRPTISWYFPGCESYFVHGQEIFFVKSLQEIVDTVNYCKGNPEIATQIGLNGAKRVLREHTFTSKIIEFLHMAKLIDKV